MIHLIEFDKLKKLYRSYIPAEGVLLVGKPGEEGVANSRRG
jgi:hypothetical protein